MVIALVCTSYAVIRFALDFLRIEDATYGALTPAQWLCLPLLLIGIRQWIQVRKAATP
jgi:prolipoprotein diacylglyceryltransferase